MRLQSQHAATLEHQLERGEVVFFPACPFSLPEGDDRGFLLEQRLARGHKNISWNPHSGKLGGFQKDSSAQAKRLGAMLKHFSGTATEWLARTLPRYASGWRLDMVSYRPEEEAGRKLRLKARNDLLHVDAFPSRPTNGQRILRLFANVNLTEPRIWVTAEPFAEIFSRYGAAVGQPPGGWQHVIKEQIQRIFRPGHCRRSSYDAFMLRLHDYLKASKEFQATAGKRFWSFPPGSAWLVFTDTASHAVLRGRFALEHSYFVSPTVLALPDKSPEAIWSAGIGRAA